MIQQPGTPKKLGGKLNSVKDRLIKPPEKVQNKVENELDMTQIKTIKMVSKGEYSIVHKVSLKTKATKFYALKEIDKKLIKKMKLVAQLQQEVDNLNKINHPHIIKLFNHFEEQNHVYLLMEYATGGTLQQKIQKSKPTQKQVKKYIVQILDALDYLHNTIQIIHRNLKPENILISDKDEIKLADFGFSNEVLQGGARRMTVIGEDEYRPPEMIKGFPHNQKADVWGVGILLFQLLAGKTPFIPLEEGETIEKNIVSNEVKFPVDIPLFIQDFIKQCLVKQQKQRPSIQELRAHNWLVTDDTVKLYNIDLTPNSEFQKFKEEQKQKFLQQKQEKQQQGSMAGSKSVASLANTKVQNGGKNATSHKNLAIKKPLNNSNNNSKSNQSLDSSRKKKPGTTIITGNKKDQLQKAKIKSQKSLEPEKKDNSQEEEEEKDVQQQKQEENQDTEERKNGESNGNQQDNQEISIDKLEFSEQNSVSENEQQQQSNYSKQTSIQSAKSIESTPKYSLVKDEFGENDGEEKKLLTKIDYEIPQKKSFQTVENCFTMKTKLEMLQNLKRNTISKLDKKKLIYQDLKGQNEMLKEKYFQYKDYSVPDYSIPKSLQIQKDEQKIMQVYNRFKGKIQNQMQKVQDLQDDLTQKSRKQELQNNEIQDLMQLFKQKDQSQDIKMILDEQIITQEQELINLSRESQRIDAELYKIDQDQEVSQLRKEIFQPHKITDDEKLSLKENLDRIHLIYMKNQEITEILEMIQNQNQQLQERFEQQAFGRGDSSVKSFYSTSSTRAGSNATLNSFKPQNSNQQDYDSQITQMKSHYNQRETILKKNQQEDTFFYRESLQKMRLSNKQTLVEQQEKYLKQRSRYFVQICFEMKEKQDYNKNLDLEIQELERQLKIAKEKFEKYEKKKKK